MNFLGHIFLTPDDDELLLGNFIADSVKGNPYKQFKKGVADGVMLHRMIDGYTDKHELVKLGVGRLKPSQGRYASVVIDVLYDHILASNWERFHSSSLHNFTQDTFVRLENLSDHFPPRVERFFPFMKAQNWLYNYQFEWGLIKSLQGLDSRSAIDTEMYLSVEVYREYEKTYFAEFEAFIKDIQNEVRTYSSSIRSV